MDILPILKALRRNKVGALLIAVQIAITLAVACNCLSVIQQYVESSSRPTGIDEANIFTFNNQWPGQPTDLSARIEGDLNAIREVPGVVGAQVTNSFPLHGGGWGWGLSVKPDQKGPTSPTTMYFVDQDGLNTYGPKLIAGRWFAAGEVADHGSHDMAFPATIVVAADLAKRLYPAGNALGQSVYWTPKDPSRIVGIVERARTPWAGFGGPQADQTTFLPYHFVNKSTAYVVRTRPGQLAAVSKAVQDRLYAISYQRVIDNVKSFAVTRNLAYFRARATAVLLGALAALLLGITVFGIIGLTMYWVGQRRQHIGMRRALGARRLDILGYFHTENLLISGAGVISGVGLGLSSNLWLVAHLEMPRMTLTYICVSALIVLALSQAAVFWPALRAASTAPAIATRGL